MADRMITIPLLLYIKTRRLPKCYYSLTFCQGSIVKVEAGKLLIANCFPGVNSTRTQIIDCRDVTFEIFKRQVVIDLILPSNSIRSKQVYK